MLSYLSAFNVKLSPWTFLFVCQNMFQAPLKVLAFTRSLESRLRRGDRSNCMVVLRSAQMQQGSWFCFWLYFSKKTFQSFLTSSHTSFPNQKANSETPKKLEELFTKRGRHLARNQSERLLEKMHRNSAPTCMKHHENMLEIKRKDTLRF